MREGLQRIPGVGRVVRHFDEEGRILHAATGDSWNSLTELGQRDVAKIFRDRFTLPCKVIGDIAGISATIHGIRGVLMRMHNPDNVEANPPVKK